MLKATAISLILMFTAYLAQGQVDIKEINFVRQGSQRMIFDNTQALYLSRFDPSAIVGQASMHPLKHHMENKANFEVDRDRAQIIADGESATSLWFGGFNPFATYTLKCDNISGEGELGFEFTDQNREEEFRVLLEFKDSFLIDVKLEIREGGAVFHESSIHIGNSQSQVLNGEVILQMLGSGFTMYLRNVGLPQVIAQADFNNHLDLRERKYINSFQTHLFMRTKNVASVDVLFANSAFTTGIGLADIRAVSYENGDPFIDNERLWYTMSIRGRALPHHIQGVFSMHPSLFDVRFEGVIVFDRGDDVLRNEIASHLFYDRNDGKWKGMTTGFSAYARPESERKQLLVIESDVDPRFGFSIMKAAPFGLVGDIEDPHIIFDEEARKWRMLTCENRNGYKAILMESEQWDRGYEKIAGPVDHNSTGTSIQKIGGQFYCFSGSSERQIWIYSYPKLDEIGNLKMDLPPWDSTSRTRVWPNVIELPDGYPFKYIALMMDRYNFPGLKGPNWTYGALYLYHGYE